MTASSTIDCEENPLPTILSAKLQEVNRFIMMTHHIQQSQTIFMNLDFWKGLSLKAELDDAAQLQSTGGIIVSAPELKIDDFVANARGSRRG